MSFSSSRTRTPSSRPRQISPTAHSPACATLFRIATPTTTDTSGLVHSSTASRTTSSSLYPSDSSQPTLSPRCSPMASAMSSGLLRWKNIHLCILFLVSAIVSTDVTFSGQSLVSAEPFPYSAEGRTALAPTTIQSKRSASPVRRSQIWVPPEGATLYEPPSSQPSTSPAPVRLPNGLVNVMSKAKSSKNNTTSSAPNPNIVSVPLQDLMADTLVCPNCSCRDAVNLQQPHCCMRP